MAMLPIFICGLILGALLMKSYINYKETKPSEVKLELLEQTIENLKEDNAILEAANKDLIEELRKIKYGNK